MSAASRVIFCLHRNGIRPDIHVKRSELLFQVHKRRILHLACMSASYSETFCLGLYEESTKIIETAYGPPTENSTKDRP